MNKSVFDLDENIAAALAYVLSFISGIVLLVLEKENKFVRFHAMQSVLLGALITVLDIALVLITGVLRSIPFIGRMLAVIPGMLHGLVGLVLFVLSVFLILKALQKEAFKLPVIGDVAEAQVGK